MPKSSSVATRSVAESSTHDREISIESRPSQPAPSQGAPSYSTSGFLRRTARRLVGSPVAKAAIDFADEWFPGARALHLRAYQRDFARISPWARRFLGVYASFPEALLAAPLGKPIGFDNAAAAVSMPAAGPLWLSDYPVLYWLEKALAESPTVLDIGGFVGTSYYSYRNYLSNPGDLRWLIQDVPAVTALGAEMARRESAISLAFTNEITSDLKAHTVLASGSLHFIEERFPELLLRMAALPAHLIVNKTPLSDHPDFVTLHDLGPAVCPYWIFNRAKFIESIQGLGYRLLDTWQNLELGCSIPFHPDRSVESYSGLHFRLDP
jgi:putative methyltransferase (TIGR04325 family)